MGQFKKDVSKWVFISFSGEEGLSFDIERGRPEDEESVCWAEKSCRMLSKRIFLFHVLVDRYHPRIPDQVHVLAFKPVPHRSGLQLRHAWRSSL